MLGWVGIWVFKLDHLGCLIGGMSFVQAVLNGDLEGLSLPASVRMLLRICGKNEYSLPADMDISLFHAPITIASKALVQRHDFKIA